MKYEAIPRRADDCMNVDDDNGLGYLDGPYLPIKYWWHLTIP